MFNVGDLIEDRLVTWLWTAVSPVILVVGVTGNVTSMIVLGLSATFRQTSAGFSLSVLCAVDTGVLVTSLLHSSSVTTTKCSLVVSHFNRAPNKNRPGSFQW